MYIPQAEDLLSRASHLRALTKYSRLISYKIFSKNSLCCADLRLVVVAHQYAVEELTSML